MYIYIAHKIKDTGQIQTVDEHCRDSARIMWEKCPVQELESIAWLTGFLHDRGKYSDKFQNYILNAVEGTVKVHKGDVNHSSAGGRIIEALLPKTLVSKMIQAAIYSHHGLRDCLSPDNGHLLFERSVEDGADIKQAVERFFEICGRRELDQQESKRQESGRRELDRRCRLAADSANIVKQKIIEFEKSMGGQSDYGHREFFLGMYERLLLSLLIEGDRTDTASFMQGKEIRQNPSEEEIDILWKECIDNLEKHIRNLKVENKVDEARMMISEQCLKAAAQSCALYRLTVPTGGGKTFSSLRFALHHAVEFKKRHIIYVAPYNSILEQNAEDIRQALGRNDIVLEYHSNVIQEDEKAEERYALLTENWESPVICTTAVQFLNTLFSSGIRNIRRMYSICNSVILFDEIQALPIKVTELFNQAVNFLTVFGKSTVVLCSATQPLLDRIETNRLCPPSDLVSDQLLEESKQIFKRTTIIDCTDRSVRGFDIDGLCDFAGDIFTEERQILIVVNTKDCAKKTYEELKEQYGKKCTVVHLSTNLCAENRHDILKTVRTALDTGRDIICVSTQLIEAGVNLSFKAVIRSLAGLDSIIQAAGRCNRHGEADHGNVYIVKMSSESENISRLTDIKEAQSAAEEVLYQYRKNPESMGNSLVSSRTMNLYYEHYFYRRKGEMKYNVNIGGAATGEDGATLVNLLSVNQLGKIEYQRKHDRPLQNRIMNQAFKTAGDLFKVISEDGKIDIVVEYYQEARTVIDTLSDPYLSITEQKRLLRKLQRYTVGISESMKRKIGNAIYPACDGKLLVLNRDYYSTETGVSDTPCNMVDMIY